MYQGKFASKNRRRRLRWNKSFVLLLSVMAVLIGLVGSSVAYLAAAESPLENVFIPGKVVATAVDTDRNGVKITNTGNTDMYVRAVVVVTWQNSANEIHASAPVEGVDYTIEWNTADWEVTDGIHRMYKETISPGDSSKPLFTKCFPVDGKAPEGYHLVAETLVEAIQADENGLAAWK